jgi:transposase
MIRLWVDSSAQTGVSNYAHEHNGFESTAIKPMLPIKPRGVQRANDRRVLIFIFWVQRSGAPWRDLPQESWAIHDMLQSLR